MLAEGLVALIALVTIMIVPAGGATGLSPGTIYGNGIGRFLTLLIGEQHLAFAVTFGAMAFSTFVFDTLDVSTRLGRYTLQELFGWGDRKGAVLATTITTAVPLVLLLVSGEGAYRSFWTLFGTSNQLLAALTLLALSVWLRRSRKPALFTLAPMAFVALTTLSSLAIQAAAAFRGAATATGVANGVVSVVLIGLALVLMGEAARSWRATPEPAA
jgi:carbon starvation protein